LNIILIREPQSIFQTKGKTQNGTFYGLWHFSYEQYYNPEYTHFGPLHAFNDFTLSPRALFPLHLHKQIEIISYSVGGEFCHEDKLGKENILKKGWIQRTTVGKGMHHSVVNNRQNVPMRFIQMWFSPSELDLEPSIEHKKVEKEERMNCFLPIVSNEYEDALSIHSDVHLFSSFLQVGRTIEYRLAKRRGAYLYVIEGGPVKVRGHIIPKLGAAKIMNESELQLKTETDTELLLIDVLL
jgi:redox-sensitive bicupin YhaK (pirin superfamily)